MEKTIKYKTKFYYCPADGGLTSENCSCNNCDCLNLAARKLLSKKEKSRCNEIAMLKKCGGKNVKRNYIILVY